MKRAVVLRRISCIAAFLVGTAIVCISQEPKNSWTVVNGLRGLTEISARSEVSAPQGAGFATLKIVYAAGANPSAVIYFIVESPKRLPLFPFDKYDGPVDMTKNEFIRFEIASGGNGVARTVQVMPNGNYVNISSEAFVFNTTNKNVVSFLLKLEDGQKLDVMVNGPPSSIRASFNTTGLKNLLEQVGLKKSGGSAIK